MINKLNELDLDIKRCEIVLKENNYLDIVIAIEEIHDNYKNTIEEIVDINNEKLLEVLKREEKNNEQIQNLLNDKMEEIQESAVFL